MTKPPIEEEPKKKLYYCSFCGLSNEEVPILVEGMCATYICPYCVAKCVEIMDEKMKGAEAPARNPEHSEARPND